MGRYKKYQPSNSNSAVGLSMGSPRLVAKNIHVQMTKENITDGPSYANVVGAFPAPRQSPIMGRRALGHYDQLTTDDEGTEDLADIAKDFGF